MKKFILALFTITLTTSLTAQVKTPQASPSGTIIQKIGMTTLTVKYSRPGVKERAIFGDLVPFGEIWRTGANENTTITIDTEITIGGQELKAGTYALFTIPNKDSWEIFFYNETKNWGIPKKWDDSKIIAKTKVKSVAIPLSVETLTLAFNNIKPNGGVLKILWDKTYIAIPFEVPTDRIVMEGIQNTMNNKPETNDYFAAAVYYFESGKDIQQAKKWIDKAVKQQKEKPKFWMIRKQSLIHAKSGDIKGAIKAAKKSLKLAQEVKNKAYIKMNEASLKEWEAL
ncbi:DUF2911 domain-containing protein [Flavicella sp.]|uniref:DUF2911 domain-containing protein n=1 Tax=Flavicella sp. TaxID=2957742 RepID=UPI003019D69C